MEINKEELLRKIPLMTKMELEMQLEIMQKLLGNYEVLINRINHNTSFVDKIYLIGRVCKLKIQIECLRTIVEINYEEIFNSYFDDENRLLNNKPKKDPEE